jgi:hypothetical protein
MKNKLSWGVFGALVVAGVVGVSLQPGARLGGESRTGAFGVGAKQAQAKASEMDAEAKKWACNGLAQVLEQFLAIDKMPRPDSCADAKSSKAPTGPAVDPKFVVATLPDPIHTHMALMFDHMAEVIQQAAQDECYSYEASWLPWDDEEEKHLLLADEDRASYRKDLVEDQPGILVFRRNISTNLNEPCYQDANLSSNDTLSPYRDGLVVFVVGEDPTKGIHADQFTNALAWIDQLKGLNKKKRARTAILGPSFSGSFPSLAKLLSNRNSRKYVRDVWGSASGPLAIHSGTANDGGSIVRFGRVSQSNSSLTALNIAFHGFLERDEVGLERYFRYLEKQHYKRSEIAVISEDETAYGGGNSNRLSTSSTECSTDALRLYYPRDIAALRAAYQTNSIFNTTAPQQSSETQRGRLPTNLADPEGPNHDTIRSYAGNQTPLSQEAYLLGIVNAMRVCHSEYVILRSTNALDELFLASYLRRAYPDARIVTDNSDRLFERERGATGMGGTISLSTYPLLEREGEWIGNHDQRVFNSDTAEGTYIAFRLLLHAQGLSEDPLKRPSDSCALQSDTEQFEPKDPADKAALTFGTLPPLSPDCNRQLQQQEQPPIPDYGVPSWMIPQGCSSNCNAFRRPATWLTVLARDGYWPIAVMNEKTIQEHGVIEDAYAFSMPLSLKLGLVFLTFFVGFHFWCCWKPSFTAKPSFRTHFANPDEFLTEKSSLLDHLVNSDEWPRHTVLIFLGGWFAALLPLFAGWGCGAFDASSAGFSNFWWVRWIVVIECLGALAAGIVNIWKVDGLRHWRKGARQHATFPIDPWALSALAFGSSSLGLILFFMVFAQYLPSCLTPASRSLAHYSNMHILNGVSAMVPLLTLTLGMYAWFWHSLHGLALFGKDRCLLPKKESLIDILRMFSQEEAADPTERCAKPLARDLVILVPAFVATFLVIIFMVSRELPVQSLIAKCYARIFYFYLVASISLMIAEAWQLLTTWTKLRQLLMFLDRTPLRRTLAALRGFTWGSVWGMSGNVLDVRYKLLSRQLESLGHAVSSLNARADEKALEAARCCLAARSCIAVMAKLQQVDEVDQSDRLAMAQSCLDALKQLRKSTTGSLRAMVDAARDCIAAQRLGTVMSDPSAMAEAQQCISALESFVTCEGQPGTLEKDCICALTETRQHGAEFAKWYARNYRGCAKAPNLHNCSEGNLESLETFQKATAEAAGTLIVRLLLPEWRTEKNSLILVDQSQNGNSDGDESGPAPLSQKEHVRDAEEFVCLPYMGFVQNILGRMRSMVMSILWLFFATAIAIASFPFDPRQALSGTMVVLFVLLGGIISYVYAQMHRDATLSHITNTKPGELGGDFWLKLVSFGVAPLLGLLTTVFPGIADFVFSWLQPGLQSIK